MKSTESEDAARPVSVGTVGDAAEPVSVEDAGSVGTVG